MKTFDNLEDAKEYAEIMGGYVLNGIDRECYLVESDDGIVIGLRCQEFVDKCVELDCWVEDELFELLTEDESNQIRAAMGL